MNDGQTEYHGSKGKQEFRPKHIYLNKNLIQNILVKR